MYDMDKSGNVFWNTSGTTSVTITSNGGVVLDSNYLIKMKKEHSDNVVAFKDMIEFVKETFKEINRDGSKK